MPLNQLKSKCIAAPDVLLIRSCLAWSLESLKVPLSCQKTLSLCVCVCTKDGKRVGEKTKGESAGKGGGKVSETIGPENTDTEERQEEQLDGEFHFFKIPRLKLLF